MLDTGACRTRRRVPPYANGMGRIYQVREWAARSSWFRAWLDIRISLAASARADQKAYGAFRSSDRRRARNVLGVPTVFRLEGRRIPTKTWSFQFLPRSKNNADRSQTEVFLWSPELQTRRRGGRLIEDCYLSPDLSTLQARSARLDWCVEIRFACVRMIKIGRRASSESACAYRRFCSHTSFGRSSTSAALQFRVWWPNQSLTWWRWSKTSRP